ncbi:hypothetical protein EJB05_46827 [Eragrostis curvula]|uniref:Uncharacterized protein n=1 Tax=Eragrostis curvula TaxID=38414 RepID=A0A5J9T5W8_9POAL|nr:hypothetical protein EJB05_46827 [Eragrostis curvula]
MQTAEENPTSSPTTLHQKPKKTRSSVVNRQDYICTQQDLDIIEPIRNTPSDGNEKLVYIGNGDADIDRRKMDCLFQNKGTKAYLIDDPINGYISMINAQEDMKHRNDGIALLETTYIAHILWRDGDKEIPMEDLYPENDEVERNAIRRRVKRYLNHDMRGISSEESGSPSDVVFCIEKETNECKSSQNQNECTSKRKRSELEEDDSDKRIDNLTPDELLQIIYGTADEPMTEMPLSKDELTDIVCDMIILLNNDPASLETKWVRTNKPYQLSLTLKQLQDSLRTDQPMSKDLFDMNVRVMTIKEHKRLKRCNQPIWKHYMDLQFCVRCPGTTKEIIGGDVDEPGKHMQIHNTTKHTRISHKNQRRVKLKINNISRRKDYVEK